MVNETDCSSATRSYSPPEEGLGEAFIKKQTFYIAKKIMKIIDAHAHLWLRQDTEVNGQKIQTLDNGKSLFMGEVRQMLPPFMIDGRNTAEVFLSNMDYAQVSAAVITQEYIDGLQNDYLWEVQQKYPNRFLCCGMVDARDRKSTRLNSSHT